VARAKQTVRAEARRRYRLAANLTEDEAGGELDAETPATAAPVSGKPAPQSRPAQASSGRPGFLSAFRGAYHPAHLREDLRVLPQLLTSRALLAGLALVLVGAVAAYAFPGYTGSAFAWELLVLPGSALTGLQRFHGEELKRQIGFIQPDGTLNPVLKTVAQAAATTLWAATAPELEGRGGLVLEDCAEALPVGPDTHPWSGFDARVADPGTASRLWDHSIDLLRILGAEG